MLRLQGEQREDTANASAERKPEPEHRHLAHLSGSDKKNNNAVRVKAPDQLKK